MAKRTLKTLGGGNAEIKVLVDGRDPHGEAGGNFITLVDVHKRPSTVGFLGKLKLPSHTTLAAHEASHICFNKGGRVVLPALKAYRKRTGKFISLYHSLGGESEGVAETAAIYMHEPDAMAKLAPELFEAMGK